MNPTLIRGTIAALTIGVLAAIPATVATAATTPRVDTKVAEVDVRYDSVGRVEAIRQTCNGYAGRAADLRYGVAARTVSAAGDAATVQRIRGREVNWALNTAWASRSTDWLLADAKAWARKRACESSNHWRNHGDVRVLDPMGSLDYEVVRDAQGRLSAFRVKMPVRLPRNSACVTARIATAQRGAWLWRVSGCIGGGATLTRTGVNGKKTVVPVTSGARPRVYAERLDCDGNRYHCNLVVQFPRVALAGGLIQFAELDGWEPGYSNSANDAYVHAIRDFGYGESGYLDLHRAADQASFLAPARYLTGS